LKPHYDWKCLLDKIVFQTKREKKIKRKKKAKTTGLEPKRKKLKKKARSNFTDEEKKGRKMKSTGLEPKERKKKDLFKFNLFCNFNFVVYISD